MIKNIEIESFRGFQDKVFNIGKVITIITGHNATGKTTLLGLLGHPAELKGADGKTIFNTTFRTQFNELFNGSFDHDKSGTFATINFSDSAFIEIKDHRKLRVTWPNQKIVIQKNGLKKTINKARFRIVSGKTIEVNGKSKRKDSKLPWPTLYLGASRLFPVGELNTEYSSSFKIDLSAEEKIWYFTTYKHILNIEDDIIDIKGTRHKETNRKKSIGIVTENYDQNSNSAGQDNLGQILLALISFKRLKEQRCKNWDGGLLLIDELEATLHPSAQVKLFKELFNFAKDNNIQVVFTTHSLYLLKTIFKLKRFDSKKYKDFNCHVINLTKKNGELEILENPDFSVLYSDLTLDFPLHEKVPILSEDDEARWLFKKITNSKFDKSISLIEAKMSCCDIIRHRKEDADFFSKIIMLLDGDADDAEIEKAIDVENKFGTKVNNIIKLPGTTRPESILFDYLVTLDSNHQFLKDNPEINKMMINENGPLSDKYENEKKEREKYKSWFNDNIELFERTNLFDYWISDNPMLVENFNKEFRKKLNSALHEIMISQL